MPSDDDELEILRLFHTRHATSAACVPSSDARLTALAPRVPKPLLEFWRITGWCSYLNGLIRLVDPDTLDDTKGDWRLPPDSVVIGRSGFGDLLALTEGKLTTIFVHTGRYQISFDSYSSSLGTLDEDDINDLFFGELYREAVNVHGEPSDSEMFTFEPALALGGAADLQHVRRVQMMPALSILSQLYEKLVSY